MDDTLIYGPCHWEDWEPGSARRTLGRTVTEADIVNFLSFSNMWEPLFADVEYIKSKSLFGRRVAPAALTYSVAEGLVLQMGWFNGTGLAFLGAEFTTPAPVYVDDTLHVRQEIVDKRETKKPDRGIVRFRELVRNQREEDVLIRTMTRMILRRSAADAGS